MTRNRVMVFLSLAAVLSVASPCAAMASVSSRKIQPIVEGEQQRPIKLYDISGDPYFSAREISKIYGSRLVYHPVTGKISLLMNNRRLDIFIKSTRYYLDNVKKRLSLPTRYLGGEVYLPSAFLVSSDFASFTEMSTTLNPDTGVLVVERKTNIHPPRFYSKRDRTQIVIGMAENLAYNWTLKKTGDIVVTFPRGRLSETKVGINDGVVRELALKNRNRQGIITIALGDKAGNVQKTLLNGPDRLLIEIERTGGSASVTQAAEESTATVKTLPVVPVTGGAKKLIVLDAGHGGDDPGAVGPNGTKEKDVNLAIVYELKRLFEEDGEYDVFLTRTDDTFIPLVERTSMANEKKADLFVSVHCNANPNRSSNGFEIYFLNENASDDDAARTALLENSVVELEGKPTGKRARLQDLLWSMTVNEFINESSELCSFITGEVTRRIRIENRGVKQAGFFVLRGAMMPAVLVECAFLSNYAEEAKLMSKKYQAQVADSIFEGVRKYETRRTLAKK